MLNLVEWNDFFDKSESDNEKPYIAQVNQLEDMVGWALFFDGKTKSALSDDGKLVVWKSLDSLINSVYEKHGLYFDIHVYYYGDKMVNLPEQVNFILIA